jgi:dTDP-4-dehydrorhamnose 3,5-epimerase
VEITAANRRQVWIPPGFAHGFVALADDTHFLYKTTDVYARPCERSLRWNDPALGIAWPLPPGVAPRLAPKDAAAPGLAEAEVFGGMA